jgi:outer membrane protein
MRSVQIGTVAIAAALALSGQSLAQQPLIPLPPGTQSAQLPPPSGPLTTPQPSSSGGRIPLPGSAAPASAQPVPPPSPSAPTPVPAPPAAQPAPPVGQPAAAQPSIKSRISQYIGPDWSGYAVVGPAYRPEYLGSEKNELGVFGDFRIDYMDKVFIGLKDGLGMNLINQPQIKMGPRIVYRFGRDKEDAAVLSQLETIDNSVELGVFMSYVWEQWEASFTADKDISNAHDGLLAEAGLSYGMEVSPELTIRFGPSVSWGNQAYMRKFYGITAAESAASGLAAYEPKSSFRDLTLGVSGDYKLDNEWSLAFEAKLIKLLEDAADSPLVKDVGDDLQVYLGAGAKYTF